MTEESHLGHFYFRVEKLKTYLIQMLKNKKKNKNRCDS